MKDDAVEKIAEEVSDFNTELASLSHEGDSVLSEYEKSLADAYSKEIKSHLSHE